MRRRGFTLIELLVVVAIIALLISILLPSLARARELSKRTVCAANLKGIGTAIATYGNDNNQDWPIPGFVTTSTAADPEVCATTYAGELNKHTVARNIQTDTASDHVSVSRGFWMLVRDGATSPGQFICPSSDDGKADDRDPEDWWDFDNISELSYGMQVPFGMLGKPTADRDPRMPLASDKGPVGSQMEATGTTPDATKLDISSLDENSTPDEWKIFNSPNHGGQGQGEGQNILYADSHVEFMRRPLEGVGLDNIFTAWEKKYTPAEFKDGSGNPILPSGFVTGNRPELDGNNLGPQDDVDTLIWP